MGLAKSVIARENKGYEKSIFVCNIYIAQEQLLIFYIFVNKRRGKLQDVLNDCVRAWKEGVGRTDTSTDPTICQCRH